MLKVISDRGHIQEAQRAFEQKLKQLSEWNKLLTVGFRGGSLEAEVYWSSRLGLWMSFGREKNRFWNAFGIREPKGQSAHNIIVEINFPYEGIHRRPQGVVAEDVGEEIFILHRGRIGGGRPGIGKELFMKEYRPLVQVYDGNKYSELGLVGALNDKRFPYQVASFVYRVADIKKLAKESEETNSTKMKDEVFSAEFAGTRVYKQQSSVKSEANHGLIVNKLADRLKALDFNPMNDTPRDVYIKRSRKSRPIHFEVKTWVDTQNIYSAVGQLMYHQRLGGRDTLLVAVLPDEVESHRVNRLREIGIETLKYSWGEDDDVIFHDLSKLMKTKGQR